LTKIGTFHKAEVVFESDERDADKSLARPGRKQATATEDFDVYIPYLHKGPDKSLARPGRKKATATEEFEFHREYPIYTGVLISP
jgi:hypothetical protein